MSGEREIRVVVVGAAGKIGRNCIRYCDGRGATVVGAIGHVRHVGEDAGAVAGIDDLGVVIEPADNLLDVIEATRPHVVIEASGNLDDIVRALEGFAQRGANVVMLSEASRYPNADLPGLEERIDCLAKLHDVTVICLGMQDVNWLNQAIVMSANCHKLDAIYGENWCILDRCSGCEMDLVGCDLDEAGFHELHRKDPQPRSPYALSLYEIAHVLGLTVTAEINDRIVPLFAQADYVPEHCEAHPDLVRAGTTIGATLGTTLETAEGITLTGRFNYSFAEGGLRGGQVWRFEGEPTYTVTTDDPRPDIAAATDVVNRLPDVIAAPSGFLTADELPRPFFRAHPLAEYL